MYDDLIKRLREDAEYGYLIQTRIGDDIAEAADAIEELVGFVQEAERDRDEYRERLDKANDAIEELQKLLDGVCADNDSLCEKIAELSKTLEAVQDAHNEGYDVGYWAGRRDYEPKWIPVSEKIPDEYTTILFITCGELHVGYYDSDHKSYCDMTGFRYMCTHWMPLPQPPKEE